MLLRAPSGHLVSYNVSFYTIYSCADMHKSVQFTPPGIPDEIRNFLDDDFIAEFRKKNEYAFYNIYLLFIFQKSTNADNEQTCEKVDPSVKQANIN